MPLKSYLRSFIPIERTLKNNKSCYFSKGKKLTKKHDDRLQHLYIPPAYTNILLAKSANNKVQVIGEDISGRKQYIYNTSHTKDIEKRKYSKLQQLIPVISRIETNITEDIKVISNQLCKSRNENVISSISSNDSISNNDNLVKYNLGLTKIELVKIIIYLLINTNLRIGNIKYLQLYNSYGLTTLEPEHLFFKNNNHSGAGGGGACQIKFIGKKGVENTTELYDTPIINILKHLLLRIKYMCNNGFNAKHLFQYIYYNTISSTYNIAIISSNDIMDYFQNNYNCVITPKMFRTWYANFHMLNYIKILITENMDTIKQLNTKNGLNKYLKKEIPIYVSNKLNNTPNICKKKYMNNELFDNIINNPTYYLKKIGHANNITALLQKILSK
jgi:DNA topoisomerase-1